ncbi:DUF362 domain-containing protein [Fundidesulfovibrio terrae]|uniref:DUF362 domain-containing protein n=1 Tax=Fundidesulfovibrio terrae TaxID=2922866 RepID=UPI001FB03E73|nr:DUF362 domain-containing protein [Fundidesulfovibrio terrae]
MPTDVFLQRLDSYDVPGLDAAAARLLELSGCRPARGDRVLVKPNLVAPSNTSLSCTRPEVVRAVCRYLADCGAHALVGDSPAFGTGRIVARACGMDKALAGLPATLVNFTRPRQLRLTQGGSIGVASQALDARFIINVPRFKVHDQMLLTLAVKNFFGCVAGFRKSWAHQVHGEKGTRFESMIMDVCRAMPRSVSLVDGILAMHVSGPAKGRPYELGLLGAAADPVALDTALAAVLGLAPDATPLGCEAGRRGLLREVAYPLASPDAFKTGGFVLPGKLAPIAFQPARFVKGRIRSLCVRLCGGKN